MKIILAIALITNFCLKYESDQKDTCIKEMKTCIKNGYEAKQCIGEYYE